MKILDKKVLTEEAGVRVVQLEILSMDIARKALPGQFVALMVSEEGERIPLTIVGTDKTKGSITLIFQEVGLTTKLLGRLNPGDSLYALTGPLGHATEIKNYGRVILVGGGVGIAELYPVAKALSAVCATKIGASAKNFGGGGSAMNSAKLGLGGKNAGNYVITILGAKTKTLLILEQELKAVSCELHIATDDGSCGKKGFTTDILQQILVGAPLVGAQQHDTSAQRAGTRAAPTVYAVGPIPMMKKVATVTRPLGIKTIVSLNALMVDATGMCGCCRVSVAGEVKFSCVDGPEFDGHAIDWDELEKRNRVYSEKELHICKLLSVIARRPKAESGAKRSLPEGDEAI